MDIEGTEFSVIGDLSYEQMRFNQLCVEIHDRFFDDGIDILKAFINRLNEAGYSIVSVSDNYEELTFLRNTLL